MVKKSSNNRRGINQRVKKHKITRAATKRNEEGTQEDTMDFDVNFIYGNITYNQLFGFAEQCFHYALDVSTNLGLIPFERTLHGTFVRLPLKKRLVHYGTILLLTFVVVYKFWATIKFISGQEILTVHTFMCITLFLVSFVAWSMSLVLVYYSYETTTMLNFWRPYLAACAGAQTYKYVTGRTSTSLQVITFVFLCHAIAFVASLISLIFGALPVCVFPAVESWGLIPDLGVPRFVWQLVFYPLELLLDMMSMYHATLAGHLLCIGIDIHAIALFQMMKIRVEDLASRRVLEDLYVQMEIYSRVYTKWLKIMIAPTLFTAGCSIVITLYITIRHTELPWFVYAGFPYVGVTLLVIIFWISYNGIMEVRDSEAILGKLQSLDASHLRDVTLAERRMVIKRAKAFRPIIYQMGPFTDLTFMMPVNIWEEVLNQLMVLLTL